MCLHMLRALQTKFPLNQLVYSSCSFLDLTKCEIQYSLSPSWKITSVADAEIIHISKSKKLQDFHLLVQQL